MDQTFGKAYKLCSKKVMQTVFESGASLKKYPLKLVYKTTELPTEKPFQVALSVPKRKFKRAPDRNRVKRIIREVIRKNKSSLETILTTNNQQIAIFIIYIGQDVLSYAEIEIKLVRLLDKLVKELDIKPTKN